MIVALFTYQSKPNQCFEIQQSQKKFENTSNSILAIGVIMHTFFHSLIHRVKFEKS